MEATLKRYNKMLNEFHNSNILNEGSNLYSYDGYNNKINKTDVIGTVVPQNSRWGITNGWKIVEVNMNNLRIRKLTPKECWRLMGFEDEEFDKAAQVCSETQLYKQAGNSIVVDVLFRIFRNLLEEAC